MTTKLHSITAVPVTPFITGTKPNLDEIARQTEAICSSRVDAIFPCASTSEFVCMDPEDKLAVLKTVAETNKGRKYLFAGAADASLPGAIRYVEAAKRLGYDSAVLCPPYYYGLGQEDVYRFYKAVTDAAEGLPIVAYHVPFFTTGIEIPTFRRLLELPGLSGMKDSSANMKRIAHVCDIALRARPDFYVYTGTDDCLLPALTAGCRGNMTALAASMPEYICGIYDAFRAGDLALAMRRQRAIEEIIRLADELTFPKGYKVLAKANGLHVEDMDDDRVPPIYEAMCKLLREGIEK